MVATGLTRLLGLSRIPHAGMAAAALLVALTAGPAFGQSANGTWNVDNDGNWSTLGNWLNDIEARGNGFTANFTNDITATRTVTLDVTRALGSVVFGDADTSSAGSWILARGGSSNFTLNNATPGTSFLTVNALGTGATATMSLIIGTGANTTLIEKNGTGTLVLSGANAFSTKLAVSAGTLRVSSDGNLGGTGTAGTDRITISNGATLATTAAFSMNANRGITIGTGGGTLNITGGALTYPGQLSGSGQTLTTSGSAGLTLTNTTGTASNVNFDLTGSGTRVFYNSLNALGTGDVRIRNNVRLVSQTTPIGATVTNAITVDSGGGISARTTGGAVEYSNVSLPSTGSVVLNRDDLATTGLTISSGKALTGILTVDTSQQAAAAVGDVTLSGIFSGASGGITKSGTGTSGKLILAGANTYGGNTTISTGTLALGATGSISDSALISVASGATFDVAAVTGGYSLGASQVLGGSGSVLGNVTALGTIAPGTSPGTLSFENNLSLTSGSILSYELNGTDQTVGSGINDLSSVLGDLVLDGTLNVTELASFGSATEGNSWRLFNYSGSLTDNTLSLGSMPTLSEGLAFAVDTGTAGQVNLVVTAVPEPATIVTGLIGLGMLGGVGARRRLRRLGR